MINTVLAHHVILGRHPMAEPSESSYNIGSTRMTRTFFLPISLIALLTGPMAHAQNWTGAMDSNWNNPANWDQWPLDGEDITIDPLNYSGAQAEPVISVASVFSPDRMFVQNGAQLGIQAGLNVGNRLIVGDDAGVTMTAGTLTTDRLVLELGGTFNLLNGFVNTLSVFALGDDGLQPSRFIQTAGTVNSSGEFGYDLAVGLSQPVYEMNGGTLTVNGDAIWLGTAPGSGQGRLIVNAGSAQINGSILNTVGSSIDLFVQVNGGTLTTNGPSIALVHAVDSLQITAGSFHVDGNVVIQNDGVVKSDLGDIYFDQQTELRGTGTYDLFNVTVSAGASLLHTDPLEIAVKGTWINLGTFGPDVNTVAFTGTASQTISSTAFYGLRMNNSGGGASLSGPTSVAGTLTLEIGMIHTQMNDLLTLLRNSTSTSGSPSSHVDGPMTKVGENAFVFPVGKNGQWRRMGINNINDQNSEYTAEFINAPFANATALNPGLVSVNQLEHWTLTRAAATDDARVELFWEDATSSGLTDCSSVVVSSWDGTAWQGVLSTTSGSCTGTDAGSVLSDVSIPTYTAFTFGSSDGTVGLDGSVNDLSGVRTAEGKLWITGTVGPWNVAIYDTNGRLLHQQTGSGNGEHVLPAFSRGIHLVQLQNGIVRHSARFVNP